MPYLSKARFQCPWRLWVMTCPSDVSSVRSFQHNSGELDRATRPWQCLDFVDPFGYQPDSKLRCFTCGSWKSLVAKGWHLST